MHESPSKVFELITVVTRFLVMTSLGVTSEKLVDAFQLEKIEHVRNVKNCPKGSNISNHARTNEFRVN